MGVTVIRLALALVFYVHYAEGDESKSFFLLAVSSPGKIIRMNPETYEKRDIIFSNPPLNARALGFDTKEEKIYWTDIAESRTSIKQSSLDGASVETVLTGEQGSLIAGLAVDSKNRQIFYTDEGRKVIGMLTLPTFTKSTIISSGLDQPRAIVLDTDNKVMFWADWGTPPKIERANYDGSDRRTVVTTSLRQPLGLALDVSNSQLFWVDPGTGVVGRCSLEGGNQTFLRTVPSRYYFSTLALFNNSLFIVDFGEDQMGTKTYSLFRLDLNINEPLKIVARAQAGRLNNIHAYAYTIISGPKSHSPPRTSWSGTAAIIAVIISIVTTVG